ncbi:unnamed protein product, partial [marine sediment metagenome]
DKLPPWAAEGVKAYSYEDVMLFTNYWVLSEPLDWEGAGYPTEVSRAYIFNYGLDNGLSDVMRLRDDLAAHRLPDPPIVCGFSVQGYCFADPTQAPPGQYTLMSWANVLYDLDELGGAQAWDDIREEYGDKVEDLLVEYVPNIKKAKIARVLLVIYWRSAPDRQKPFPPVFPRCWKSDTLLLLSDCEPRQRHRPGLCF